VWCRVVDGGEEAGGAPTGMQANAGGSARRSSADDQSSGRSPVSRAGSSGSGVGDSVETR